MQVNQDDSPKRTINPDIGPKLLGVELSMHEEDIDFQGDLEHGPKFQEELISSPTEEMKPISQKQNSTNEAYIDKL